MASFTNTQQVEILAYLGYAQFGSAGAIDLQFTNLRDYLLRDTFTLEYMGSINTVLLSLKGIDTKIDSLIQLINIKKADVIEFNSDQGLGTLYMMGSTLVKRLSSLVGFPVLVDPYQSGYSSSYLGGY
jgi:hypothetical protein